MESADRTADITLRDDNAVILARAEKDAVFALGETIKFRIPGEFDPNDQICPSAVWVGEQPMLIIRPALRLCAGDSLDVNVSAVLSLG